MTTIALDTTSANKLAIDNGRASLSQRVVDWFTNTMSSLNEWDVSISLDNDELRDELEFGQV